MSLVDLPKHGSILKSARISLLFSQKKTHISTDRFLTSVSSLTTGDPSRLFHSSPRGPLERLPGYPEQASPFETPCPEFPELNTFGRALDVLFFERGGLVCFTNCLVEPTWMGPQALSARADSFRGSGWLRPMFGLIVQETSSPVFRA